MFARFANCLCACFLPIWLRNFGLFFFFFCNPCTFSLRLSRGRQPHVATRCVCRARQLAQRWKTIKLNATSSRVGPTWLQCYHITLPSIDCFLRLRGFRCTGRHYHQNSPYGIGIACIQVRNCGACMSHERSLWSPYTVHASRLGMAAVRPRTVRAY